MPPYVCSLLVSVPKLTMMLTLLVVTVTLGAASVTDAGMLSDWKLKVCQNLGSAMVLPLVSRCGGGGEGGEVRVLFTLIRFHFSSFVSLCFSTFLLNFIHLFFFFPFFFN